MPVDWCSVAIATGCYQTHAVDKGCVIFMPLITVKYLMPYNRQLQEVRISVEKAIIFQIMTVLMSQYKTAVSPVHLALSHRYFFANSIPLKIACTYHLTINTLYNP